MPHRSSALYEVGHGKIGGKNAEGRETVHFKWSLPWTEEEWNVFVTRRA